MDAGDDRTPLSDPASSRRGAVRTVLAGIVVVVLLTGFTAGGAAMLAAGELPGLPFAVGGAVAQLAAIAIVVTVLRTRSGTGDGSISRSRVASAVAAFVLIRAVLFVTFIGLVLFSLVRVVLGDNWSLLTAGIIGLMLFLLARGARRLTHGLKRTYG
ncbi:hypothetical protein BDK92_1660 [Micromonospora pisi]|uniref:ATP synthase protein I n=1 Tax=Micromonospora pisi TaxID=589240 RepID=A0A495JEP6_9ACTN|nr:hypothetical protein BDK92_1660 [Micromonospora pisi]